MHSACPLKEKQAVYAADEAYYACEGDAISKMEAAFTAGHNNSGA
jgi:hypothetical protein